ATYEYVLDNLCGTTDTLSFTVPTTIPALQQTVNVAVQQLCNNGGTITITTNYNAYANRQFVIISGNDTFYDNTGIFPNLTSGTYSAGVRIIQSGNCDLTEYWLLQPAVITPNGSAPQIIKKIGIVCEDNLGNPTSFGSIFFEAIGVAPYLVEVKEVNANDSTYITITSNSNGIEEITGLDAGVDYRVRIS